jgi:hypothetical protein
MVNITMEGDFDFEFIDRSELQEGSAQPGIAKAAAVPSLEAEGSVKTSIPKNGDSPIAASQPVKPQPAVFGPLEEIAARPAQASSVEVDSRAQVRHAQVTQFSQGACRQKAVLRSYCFVVK